MIADYGPRMSMTDLDASGATSIQLCSLGCVIDLSPLEGGCYALSKDWIKTSYRSGIVWLCNCVDFIRREARRAGSSLCLINGRSIPGDRSADKTSLLLTEFPFIFSDQKSSILHTFHLFTVHTSQTNGSKHTCRVFVDYTLLSRRLTLCARRRNWPLEREHILPNDIEPRGLVRQHVPGCFTVHGRQRLIGRSCINGQESTSACSATISVSVLMWKLYLISFETMCSPGSVLPVLKTTGPIIQQTTLLVSTLLWSSDKLLNMPHYIPNENNSNSLENVQDTEVKLQDLWLDNSQREAAAWLLQKLAVQLCLPCSTLSDDLSVVEKRDVQQRPYAEEHSIAIVKNGILCVLLKESIQTPRGLVLQMPRNNPHLKLQPSRCCRCTRFGKLSGCPLHVTSLQDAVLNYYHFDHAYGSKELPTKGRMQNFDRVWYIRLHRNIMTVSQCFPLLRPLSAISLQTQSDLSVCQEDAAQGEICARFVVKKSASSTTLSRLTNTDILLSDSRSLHALVLKRYQSTLTRNWNFPITILIGLFSRPIQSTSHSHQTCHFYLHSDKLGIFKLLRYELIRSRQIDVEEDDCYSSRMNKNSMGVSQSASLRPQPEENENEEYIAAGQFYHRAGVGIYNNPPPPFPMPLELHLDDWSVGQILREVTEATSPQLRHKPVKLQAVRLNMPFAQKSQARVPTLEEQKSQRSSMHPAATLESLRAKNDDVEEMGGENLKDIIHELVELGTKRQKVRPRTRKSIKSTAKEDMGLPVSSPRDVEQQRKSEKAILRSPPRLQKAWKQHEEKMSLNLAKYLKPAAPEVGHGETKTSKVESRTGSSPRVKISRMPGPVHNRQGEREKDTSLAKSSTAQQQSKEIATGRVAKTIVPFKIGSRTSWGNQQTRAELQRIGLRQPPVGNAGAIVKPTEDPPITTHEKSRTETSKDTAFRSANTPKEPIVMLKERKHGPTDKRAASTISSYGPKLSSAKRHTTERIHALSALSAPVPHNVTKPNQFLSKPTGLMVDTEPATARPNLAGAMSSKSREETRRTRPFSGHLESLGKQHSMVGILTQKKEPGMYVENTVSYREPKRTSTLRLSPSPGVAGKAHSTSASDSGLKYPKPHRFQAADVMKGESMELGEQSHSLKAAAVDTSAGFYGESEGQVKEHKKPTQSTGSPRPSRSGTNIKSALRPGSQRGMVSEANQPAVRLMRKAELSYPVDRKVTERGYSTLQSSPRTASTSVKEETLNEPRAKLHSPSDLPLSRKPQDSVHSVRVVPEKNHTKLTEASSSGPERTSSRARVDRSTRTLPAFTTTTADGIPATVSSASEARNSELGVKGIHPKAALDARSKATQRTIQRSGTHFRNNETGLKETPEVFALQAGLGVGPIAKATSHASPSQELTQSATSKIHLSNSLLKPSVTIVNIPSLNDESNVQTPGEKLAENGMTTKFGIHFAELNTVNLAQPSAFVEPGIVGGTNETHLAPPDTRVNKTRTPPSAHQEEISTQALVETGTLNFPSSQVGRVVFTESTEVLLGSEMQRVHFPVTLLKSHSTYENYARLSSQDSGDVEALVPNHSALSNLSVITTATQLTNFSTATTDEEFSDRFLCDSHYFIPPY
ncbi:unnamed protein product [Dicrocoelium dendriticum]|nr:unnamed protein product [Dicrocoelium dendriticum]